MTPQLWVPIILIVQVNMHTYTSHTDLCLLFRDMQDNAIANLTLLTYYNVIYPAQCCVMLWYAGLCNIVNYHGLHCILQC